MGRAKKQSNLPTSDSVENSESRTNGRAKRKFESPNADSTHVDGTPASKRATVKKGKCADNLFYSYANKSLGMIDPEGIEALCSDLGVDHMDVRILMLAWKMNAEKQGYFSLDEWQKVLKAFKVDSIKKLKETLTKLEKEVRMPQNFEDFYAYAFRYCLTEEKQKYVDIEGICELLNLVLGSQFRPQVDKLTEYLNVQSDYKMINFDQWTSFLRFCSKISFPDLENYDASEAWPLILDNFVEWIREKEQVAPK